MKLHFPIIQDDATSYPKEPLCPWCKKQKVLEPHSFAVLGGGALLKSGDGASGPSSELEGFLHFSWHGAHDGGQGRDPGAYGCTEVVRDVIGGQFDLYFCSTDCLRSFLNACVDDLEQKIRKSMLQP
jgi:hypothetical protein